MKTDKYNILKYVMNKYKVKCEAYAIAPKNEIPLGESSKEIIEAKTILEVLRKLYPDTDSKIVVINSSETSEIIPLSIYPGEMQFTVTPEDANSLAIVQTLH